MKRGKMAIVLRGRYAGRKAIILDVNENGTTERKYPHCIVVGINRYPRKVHKGMSKARIERKIKIKPFVKCVNLSHLMPTRYAAPTEINIDAFAKKIETAAGPEEKDALVNADFRETLRKEIKVNFEKTYTGLDLNSTETNKQRLKFFFRRLKF